MGFGSRTGAAGVVSMGFGTSARITVFDDAGPDERAKRFKRQREELRDDIQAAVNRVLGIELPDDPDSLVVEARKVIPDRPTRKQAPRLREIQRSLVSLDALNAQIRIAREAEDEEELEQIIMAMHL